MTGRHAAAKTINYPQKLETLAVWKELFPLEVYEPEPESNKRACVNIDLGLDQMEDYAST